MPDQIQKINNLVAAGNIKAAKNLIARYLLDNNPIDEHLNNVIRTIHLLERSWTSGELKPTRDNQADNEMAYDFYALTPGSIDYIETHGLDEREEIHNFKDEASVDSHIWEVEVSVKDISAEHELDYHYDSFDVETEQAYSTEFDGEAGFSDKDVLVDDEIPDFRVDSRFTSIDDEFDWDRIEDYDDLYQDNDEAGAYEWKYTNTNAISKQERARQIATEIIYKYDWEVNSLDLLISIFCEHGWAATRASIEFEMSRGLTKDELSRAYFIRQQWSGNQHYWTNLFYISTNLPGQTTAASFSVLGWREAIRIVRRFSALPSEEEMQSFIDEIYDDWYSSSFNRSSCKAFIFYLKYRIGSIRDTLPPQELFTFSSIEYSSSTISGRENYSSYINSIEQLREEGIDLYDMIYG